MLVSCCGYLVLTTVPDTKTAVIRYKTIPISIEKIVPFGIARNGSWKIKNFPNESECDFTNEQKFKHRLDLDSLVNFYIHLFRSGTQRMRDK